MKNIKLIILFTLSAISVFSQDRDFDLIVAAEKGDTTEVIELLKQGANVDAQTYDGISPLMYASQNGHVEIIKILLENDCDLEIKSNNTMTALFSAVRANKLDAAELLLKNGADINARDTNKASPLLYAIANGWFIMADMLIFYKAKIIPDDYGTTPLMIATLYGYTDIVELLINKGENVNRKDKYGYTSLMIATQNGYYDIVKILIENGSDINITSNKNTTALCIAAEYGQDSIINYLITKETNVNHKVNKRITPLTLAKLNKKQSTVNTLKAHNARNSLMPHFNRIGIGITQNFNFNDYMMGLNIGFLEAKYEMEYLFGWEARPFRKRVLIEESENFYYQLREFRSIFYANIIKRFNLSTSNNNNRGIFVGVKEIYNFGNYKAMNRKVERKFNTVPQLGIYWMSKNTTLKLNYEYVDFDTYKVSPHRICFTTMFHFNISKYSKFKRELHW